MHRTPTVALAALIAAAGLAGPTHAEEEPFANLIAFGDSLSDPGNLAALGFGPPSPPYFQGQFSNGPVWALLFPDVAGFTTEANLNFAVGAATSGSGPTDLLSQVGGYLASGRQAEADDLFSIWIGGNDYNAAAAAAAADPANAGAIVSAAIDTTLTNTAGAISQLATVGGAQQFLVFNLPDLGLTPLINGDPAAAAGASSITALHNQSLATTMADVAAGLNVDITLVDIGTLFDDVVANPAKYGFTNVTDPCVDGFSVCSLDLAEQNTFLFWDSFHPTAVAHEITAAYAADTVLAPRTIAAQGEVAADTARRQINELGQLAGAARALGEGESQGFAGIGYADFERDGQVDAVGFTADSIELSGGGAARLGPGLVLAGVVTLSDGEADLAGDIGGFDVTGIRAGGVLGFDVGLVQAAASAGVSLLDYGSIERNTGVVGQIASGETSASSFSAALEGFAPFGSEAFTFGPLAQVSYARVIVDGYGENGATGLNQLVFERDFDLAWGELGGRAHGGAGGFDWRVDAAWVEAFSDDEQTVETALVTVPELVRSLETEGSGDGYARLDAAAGFDTGGFRLEIGGRADVARDEADSWNAYARVGRRF